MKPLHLLVVLSLACVWSTAAAEKKAAAPNGRPANGKGSVKLVEPTGKTEEVVFKKTPQGELKLYLHFPADWKASDQRPAILFFFGGGWKNGTAVQFLPQAEYLATRGMVTVRADYRIASVHGTTPDVCVEDAKSAMRWLRGHAKQYGIDPEKLVASGGSAGGHLAAAVALTPGFDAPGDDKKISCVPNALVLFNPALNLGLIPNTFTNAAGEKINEKISTTPFMKADAPPAVIFFGTADTLKAHGDEYLAKAKQLKVRCEQYTAAEQKHGFFNAQPWATVTAIQADRFLASLGYVKGEPTLKSPDSAAVLQRSE